MGEPVTHTLVFVVNSWSESSPSSGATRNHLRAECDKRHDDGGDKEFQSDIIFLWHRFC